jgi:hypothetical protein
MRGGWGKTDRFQELVSMIPKESCYESLANHNLVKNNNYKEKNISVYSFIFTSRSYDEGKNVPKQYCSFGTPKMISSSCMKAHPYITEGRCLVVQSSCLQENIS